MGPLEDYSPITVDWHDLCSAANRAIKKKYLTYEMIEMMDPSAMFAIPRLAILWWVEAMTPPHRV